MQKSDISDHIRTYSSPLPMHFVQLLSSIFFLIREPLAIWMLMLLGSLYPIYIKRKNRIFLPLWMGMFKLPSHRRKRSEMRTFPSGSTFWAAIASVHENMSSMPSQSPLTVSFIFHNELGCPLMQKPYLLDEFMNLFLIFIFRIILPTFLYLSVAPLKKSGIFLYSLFFAHFREIF